MSSWALVTGFGPFDGHPTNPSESILRRLPDQLANVRLIKCVLAVDYKLLDLLYRHLERVYAQTGSSDPAPMDPRLPRDLFLQSTPPLFIVHLGVSSATDRILLESRAFNAAYGLDIRGHEPPANRISDAYPLHHALLSALKLSDVCSHVDATRGRGSWVAVSQDAGRYLCNYSYFKALLFEAQYGTTRGLFIHVPPEDTPLSLHVMTEIVQQSLEAVFGLPLGSGYGSWCSWFRPIWMWIQRVLRRMNAWFRPNRLPATDEASHLLMQSTDSGAQFC